MSNYDKKSLLKVIKALNIVAITANTTTTGISIDTKSFGSLTFSVELGARTDGSFLPLIQDSDDNVNFVDVVDQSLIGTEAEILLNSANTVKTIGYNGKKRYVRLSLVSSGVSSGATATANAILSDADSNPVA